MTETGFLDIHAPRLRRLRAERADHHRPRGVRGSHGGRCAITPIARCSAPPPAGRDSCRHSTLGLPDYVPRPRECPTTASVRLLRLSTPAFRSEVRASGGSGNRASAGREGGGATHPGPGHSRVGSRPWRLGPAHAHLPRGPSSGCAALGLEQLSPESPRLGKGHRGGAARLSETGCGRGNWLHYALLRAHEPDARREMARRRAHRTRNREPCSPSSVRRSGLVRSREVANDRAGGESRTRIRSVWRPWPYVRSATRLDGAGWGCLRDDRPRLHLPVALGFGVTCLHSPITEIHPVAHRVRKGSPLLTAMNPSIQTGGGSK